MKILHLTLIAFILILTTGCMSSLDTNTSDEKQVKIEELEKWLKERYEKKEFHGSVLLAEEGKVIFHKQYGYEDIENKDKLSSHSSFNIASLSKPFTAMAIMLLEQDNKLDYDDEITEYIPEWNYLSGITIKHLLQHTSGLEDYIALTDEYWDEEKVFTTDEMIKLFEEYQPKARFNAGEKFEYSNTGYVLLAEIVERVSKEEYANFMQKNIFKPLNMNDSAIFNKLSPKETLEHRVYGFGRAEDLDNPKVLNDLDYLDGVAGDGGVYTTASDLLKWSRAIKKGTLVSKENYKKAFEYAVLNDGSRSDYGFGWNLNEDGSYNHAGEWIGFSSYMSQDVKEDKLLIVLDSSTNVSRIAPSLGSSKNDSITLNLIYFMKMY